MFNRSKNKVPTVTDCLDAAGYEIVDLKQIGQDPAMYSVVSIVVGRNFRSGEYATWEMSDWSMHPDSKDRLNGCNIYYGHYSMTYEEAIKDANKRYTNMLKRYTWVIPGTKDRIPGCNGSSIKQNGGNYVNLP